MKEIIKKVAIAVVAVIAVIVAGFSLLGNDEPDVTQTTTSSVAGTTAPAGNDTTVYNQGGDVNADATTDTGAQTTTGAVQQPPSDNAGVQQPTSDNSGVQQPTTQQTTSYQQGTTYQAPSQSLDTTAGQLTSSQPENSTVVQQDTSTPYVTQQPSQPANKIDAYQEIFKSGRFLMKVGDPDLGPVTMAMSGNKMLVEASMDGLSLKMLYDGSKPDKDNPSQGTWYIIIDKIKKYSPISADMIGDMSVEELTKDLAKGDSNTVYVKSTETLDGEVYECESCTDAGGNITKYYFKGDRLVRSDSISPSGEVSTTLFEEITADFDESIFTIPDDYAMWDISWLMNMVA